MRQSEIGEDVVRRRKQVIIWIVPTTVGLLGLLMLAGRGAKARAEMIQCANVLSSLELAARTYSIDYEGRFAPNLQCMSNEIFTTRILICPGDRSRMPALNFAAMLPTNGSYVYLAANLHTTNATTNAIFRCPVHGHTVYGDGRIVLGDGTVQYGKRFF